MGRTEGGKVWGGPSPVTPDTPHHTYNKHNAKCNATQNVTQHMQHNTIPQTRIHTIHLRYKIQYHTKYKTIPFKIQYRTIHTIPSYTIQNGIHTIENTIPYHTINTTRNTQDTPQCTPCQPILTTPSNTMQYNTIQYNTIPSPNCLWNTSSVLTSWLGDQL